jgi:hypothetical protein
MNARAPAEARRGAKASRALACICVRCGGRCLLSLTLRHAVARFTIWQSVLTRPVVPSTVSYVVRQQGNTRSKAHGQSTHSHPTGTCTVRERCSCQHQAETGLDGWEGKHTCTLDKRRQKQQAEEADRLGPTGHRSGYRVVSVPCHGHPTLPAHREYLTRPW